MAELPRSLPCAERTPFGTLDIGRMPGADQVQRFMHALLEPYTYANDGRNVSYNSAPWWREFDATQDVQPGRGAWARPFGARAERDYLDVVCGLLRSNLIGAWSRALRENAGVWVPAGWGPRGGFNSSLDRLLNRVGVNHAVAFGRLVQVDWSQDDAGYFSTSPTIFALPESTNPWLQFRRFLAAGSRPETWIHDVLDEVQLLLQRVVPDAVLGGIVGVLDNVRSVLESTIPEPPTVFAFPCDWNLAQRHGLISDADLATLNTLIGLLANTNALTAEQATTAANVLTSLHSALMPPGVLGPLVSALDNLEPVFDVLNRVAPNGLTNMTVSQKARAALQLMRVIAPFWVTDVQNTIRLAIRILEVLAEVFSASVYIDRASAPGLPANRALAELLMAITHLARLPYGESDADRGLEELFGVDISTMKAIVQGLDDRSPDFAGASEWSWTPSGPPTPLVYLDECFQSYAEHFDDFEEHRGVPDDIAPGQEHVAAEWESWWFQVSPVVQAFETFDMAGQVVTAMAGMDDAVSAALSALTRSTGAVGGILANSLGTINTTLTTFGMPPLDRSLKALDVPRLWGDLVRQVFTDVFIEHMVREHGASRECLYALSCCMDTEEKRNLIEAVYGELVKVPVPVELEAAFIQVVGSSPASLWVRACVTPEVFAQSNVNRGALGDIFWGAVQPAAAVGVQLQTPSLVGVLAMLGANRAAVGRLGVTISASNSVWLSRWMSHSDIRCTCDFRERLEPDWTMGETRSPGEPEGAYGVLDSEDPL